MRCGKTCLRLRCLRNCRARGSSHPPRSLGRAKKKQMLLRDSNSFDARVHALVANMGFSSTGIPACAHVKTGRGSPRHARSKNAFFGFLVLRRRAHSKLGHRQECLCYRKALRVQAWIEKRCDQQSGHGMPCPYSRNGYGEERGRRRDRINSPRGAWFLAWAFLRLCSRSAFRGIR